MAHAALKRHSLSSNTTRMGTDQWIQSDPEVGPLKNCLFSPPCPWRTNPAGMSTSLRHQPVQTAQVTDAWNRASAARAATVENATRTPIGDPTRDGGGAGRYRA
jgi:hypothetical protein